MQIGDLNLIEMQDYEAIWVHQFLRAGVLMFLFGSMPEPARAKEMDGAKRRIQKPLSHKLFMTTFDLAVFAESTSRGKATANCLQSLKSLNMEVAAADRHPFGYAKQAFRGSIGPRDVMRNIFAKLRTRIFRLVVGKQPR